MEIPVATPVLGAEETRCVMDALESGFVSSLGEYVERFESLFAEFCSVRHGVAASSGTTALHLAIAATGIGPGDEVIVPALSFVATANAVRYVGATPVFADVDPEYWGITVETIEPQITSRTKAIISVHLFGHPIDQDEINDLAKRHELMVIEDAAQAHGAEVRGRRVGGLGYAGVFSFFGNKIITTGEGGMVTTNDADFADRCRFLRGHGMDDQRAYYHPELGFNYRMTNLQAALGVAQMKRIDEFVERKRQIAARYRAALDGVPGLGFLREHEWARCVHWMSCVVVGEGRRSHLVEALTRNGIDSRPFFEVLPALPMYLQPLEPFPVATRLAGEGLYIPSGCGLSDGDVDRVVDVIRAWALG